MKNSKVSYFLLTSLLSLCVMWGCSEENGSGMGEKQIDMPDKSEQTQHAYADEETTGGFTFTAKAPWKADVTLNTTSRVSSVSWLRLFCEGVETYSGDAGKFTLTIELDANYSGESRSATIVITVGNDKITVTVSQEGKNREGELPENRRLIVNITETASFNSDYYSNANSRTYNPYYYEFKYDEQDRLKEYCIWEKNDGRLYSQITLSYDIQGEIRLTDNNDGEYEHRTYVAELDSSGYVSKMIQAYGEGKGYIDFEYTTEGYLSKITTYLEEHEYDDPGIIDLYWDGGNLTHFTFNGDKEGVALFAPELNGRTNIDLNAFFFGLLANDPLFEYPNDMEENILAMADRFGKRSRNYMRGREYEVDEEQMTVKIYTERNEPALGTAVHTFYDRNFYGEGYYSFDDKGYPTAFTHQVKVVKDEYIYNGEREYVEPENERQQAEWLNLYGEGPYFLLNLDNEQTITYDNYIYQITYKE